MFNPGPETFGALALVLLLAVGIRSIFNGQFADRRADARINSRVFRLAAERSGDGIVLQDMTSRVIWANPAYFRIMGRKPEEVVGKQALEYALHPDDRPNADEIAVFRFDPHSPEFTKPTIYRNWRPSGETFWAQLTMSMVDLNDGNSGVLLNCRDVTEQIDREKRLTETSRALEFSATHDPLTGLANRSAVLEFGKHALHQGAISGQPTGLMHIDLDRFKEINDRYGHPAGDAVLCQTAAVLKATVRGGDLVGRVGGDEFVVVCPGITSLDELQRLARKIITSLEVPIKWGDGSILCSASIGIALSSAEHIDLQSLTAMADSALYEVKRAGRGTIAAYDECLHKNQQYLQQMQSDLAEMIRTNRLEFRHQPVVDLKNSVLLGFEVLAHWHHPERGLIPPSVFLPMAHSMNLMFDLDMAAMQACLDASARLRSEGFDWVTLSFNASSHTLAQDSFHHRLSWEMDRLNLAHEMIVVEVQETSFLASNRAERVSQHTIERLRSAGVRIALDDFGLGYAGLAHMAQLEVNGVKIDRTLVDGIAESPARGKVFRTLVDLCSALDMRVIAKGVEDDATAKAIAKLGCHIVQGDVAGQSMPAEEIAGWIRTKPFKPAPARTNGIPNRQAS